MWPWVGTYHILHKSVIVVDSLLLQWREEMNKLLVTACLDEHINVHSFLYVMLNVEFLDTLVS